MSAQLPDTWDQVSVRVRTASTVHGEAGGAPRKRKKRQHADADKRESGPKDADMAGAALSAPRCKAVEKKELLSSSKSATVASVQSSLLGTIASWSDASAEDKASAMQEILSNVSKNLQGIVSMTGFKKLLRDETKSLFYVNDIMPISKKYEDSYLRQPIASGERACVRGSQCECMLIDPTQGFVGVEFLLPWEKPNATRSGLCLPCLRAATQLLFFEILQSRERIEGVIQRFYNKHSEEGEYAIESMLVCPPNGPVHNLPMPVHPALLCLFLFLSLYCCGFVWSRLNNTSQSTNACSCARQTGPCTTCRCRFTLLCFVLSVFLRFVCDFCFCSILVSKNGITQTKTPRKR